MFDYDRTIKHLVRFDDLSGRQKQEVLEDIFLDSGFREWFYQVGEGANAQPMTSPMIQKLFTTLCIPTVFRGVIKFFRNYDYDKIDRTACSLGFLVVEQAIDQSNKASQEVSDDYREGKISGKEAKEYKARSETYNEMISDFVQILKSRVKSEVSSLAQKCNLPTSLAYATYFMVPGRKYIPKFKISMFMNQLLSEIYKWVGVNGIDEIELIHWGPFFGSFFGNELTASAAVSILLEGVQRIDPYRDAENFDDVRGVWDSLTNFALSELNNAPEHVRRQMLELYTKRITKIFSNGRSPRLRVDLLAIPSDFQNLLNTVRRYGRQIHEITKSPNYVPDETPRDAEGMRHEANARRMSERINDDGDPDDELSRDIRRERERRERERRNQDRNRDRRDDRRRDRDEDPKRSSRSIFDDEPSRYRDDLESPLPDFTDEDDEYERRRNRFDRDDDEEKDDDDGDYYPPEEDDDDDFDPLDNIDPNF